MTVDLQNFVLIEDEEALAKFYETNRSVSWMGFDTEFVGEKRYFTLLCLIQVATVHGYFLIDSLKVKDLSLFLRLVEDPNICKITHAGENDYRLLYQNHRTVPKNIFDTQIAAGFVGYKYPISFGKLVEKEVRVHLSKGYTVSDWESRPFSPRQLKYALNDIVYLERLWELLSGRLEKMKRTEWVKEEFLKLESASYYELNPHREAFNNSLILGLNNKEQLFLIRLYEWRRSRAEMRNYSKEMILPAKFIGAIVRNMRSGKAALLNHRRIPSKIIDQNWENFLRLYKADPTEEERILLAKIPEDDSDNQRDETLMEMLYLIIKYTCQKQKVAPDLVMSRSIFKKMKMDPTFFDESLNGGWRRKLLGEGVIRYLHNREDLTLDFDESGCTLRVEEGKPAVK